MRNPRAVVVTLVACAALAGIQLVLGAQNQRSSSERNESSEPFERSRALSSIAPVVSLTAPAEGASYLAPAAVTLLADARDPDGRVKSVNFYANGHLIGSRRGRGRSNRTEYGLTWSGVAVGSYTLTATATSEDGAVTTSAPVHIVVRASLPPTVSISSPVEGTIVPAPATIQLAANASDPDGRVTRVDFYRNGSTTPIAFAMAAPWRAIWPNVAAGTYTLTAVATDNSGTSTTSAPVHIIVNALPTVSITSPVEGATFTAPADITIAATPADADGTIARVAFYHDSDLTPIGGNPVTAPPYQVTWSGVTAGTYALTAVVTDDRGAMTTSMAVHVTVRNPPPTPTEDPLVNSANLLYRGTFRLPDMWDPAHPLDNFEYGGTTIAFNPSRNTLWLGSFAQTTTELDIPLDIPPVRYGATVTDLPIAQVNSGLLTPFTDLTASKLEQVRAPDSFGAKTVVGGMLTDGTRAYVSAYDYYDGTGSQTLSHFIVNATSPGIVSARGPFTVTTDPAVGTGFVDGYMERVPGKWQDALGGPAMAGNCCLNVISRTSWGPALFAIDPSKIGFDPNIAKPLLYYPCFHDFDPTECHPLAVWNETVPQNSVKVFNGTTAITGVVFPTGWRSVLFFGRQGIGAFCYGQGTSDRSKAFQPIDPNYPDIVYCYDWIFPDQKGSHAPPYFNYVWAYDARDLQAVALGTKQPWEVLPYATWQLDFPFFDDSAQLGGAAYDPKTNRIFVSEMFGDGTKPLIHVFSLRP